MNKIYITTFIKAHNYGAALQAYALQECLKERGYISYFLNYKDELIERNYKIVKVNGKNLKQRLKSFIRSVIFFNLNFKHYKKFQLFEEKKLNLYPLKPQKAKYFYQENFDRDILITGSDQVWNYEITNGLSDIYSLNFGSEKTKKISYAASTGKNKIDDSLILEYAKKLSKINMISVRENTGKMILKEIIPQKDISVVLDPTLLLTKEIWTSKVQEMEAEKEKYILAYMVEEDKEYMKIVEELSNKTGLKIIHFDKRNKYRNVLRKAYIDGPLEFVNLIKNAEYVVATSFHATVFSIIFNNKFWIVPHKTTGSRVTDLLKKFNISNRAVTSLEEFKEKNYDENINYEEVNKILEKEREKSLKWLIDAIEK